MGRVRVGWLARSRPQPGVDDLARRPLWSLSDGELRDGLVAVTEQEARLVGGQGAR